MNEISSEFVYIAQFINILIKTGTFVTYFKNDDLKNISTLYVFTLQRANKLEEVMSKMSKVHQTAYEVLTFMKTNKIKLHLINF